MCVCVCVCVVSQLLWEKEREEMGLTEKQTFIDLGCGNGLLVYLLTSEGVHNTYVYILYHTNISHMCIYIIVHSI